jgi:hypothetical protein
MVDILAVVGGDMILDTDPLCGRNNNVLTFSAYLCVKSLILSFLHILSIFSVKRGWKR